MMPMAGQDAVLDAAAFERETHMRTAIIERENVPAFVYEEDRAMASVHNEPPFGFQLLKAARPYEIRRRDIHGRPVRQKSTVAPFSKGILRMSNPTRRSP